MQDTTTYILTLSCPDQRGIVLASTFQNYVPVAGALNPVTGQMEDNATIITPRLFGISISRNF